MVDPEHQELRSLKSYGSRVHHDDDVVPVAHDEYDPAAQAYTQWERPLIMPHGCLYGMTHKNT